MSNQFQNPLLGSGARAFEIAKKNPHRSMSKWAGKFDGIAKIEHTARFQFDVAAKVFTIGSCFAREVENHLRLRGMKLLSAVPVLPGSNYEIGGQDRTGYQNVYTPGSVLEAIRLNFADDAFHSLVRDGDQGYDLLTSGLLPLPMDDVRKIRGGLIETYRRLEQTDILVVTLGYNESWSYLPSGSFINWVPSSMPLRRRIEEFGFETLSYERSRALLSEGLELVKKLAPACKVILTVSPVPLTATFSSRSIVLANQQSKSTLLAVATSLRDELDFVDYFPSYELIVNSDRSKVFAEDGIHVRREAIKEVMQLFFSSYIASEMDHSNAPA
jgi:hypothetical protein